MFGYSRHGASRHGETSHALRISCDSPGYKEARRLLLGKGPHPKGRHPYLSFTASGSTTDASCVEMSDTMDIEVVLTPCSACEGPPFIRVVAYEWTPTSSELPDVRGGAMIKNVTRRAGCRIAGLCLFPLSGTVQDRPAERWMVFYDAAGVPQFMLNAHWVPLAASTPGGCPVHAFRVKCPGELDWVLSRRRHEEDRWVHDGLFRKLNSLERAAYITLDDYIAQEDQAERDRYGNYDAYYESMRVLPSTEMTKAFHARRLVSTPLRTVSTMAWYRALWIRASEHVALSDHTEWIDTVCEIVYHRVHDSYSGSEPPRRAVDRLVEFLCFRTRAAPYAKDRVNRMSGARSRRVTETDQFSSFGCIPSELWEHGTDDCDGHTGTIVEMAAALLATLGGGRGHHSSLVRELAGFFRLHYVLAVTDINTTSGYHVVPILIRRDLYDQLRTPPQNRETPLDAREIHDEELPPMVFLETAAEPLIAPRTEAKDGRPTTLYPVEPFLAHSLASDGGSKEVHALEKWLRFPSDPVQSMLPWVYRDVIFMDVFCANRTAEYCYAVSTNGTFSAPLRSLLTGDAELKSERFDLCAKRLQADTCSVRIQLGEFHPPVPVMVEKTHRTRGWTRYPVGCSSRTCVVRVPFEFSAGMHDYHERLAETAKRVGMLVDPELLVVGKRTYVCRILHSISTPKSPRASRKEIAEKARNCLKQLVPKRTAR